MSNIKVEFWPSRNEPTGRGRIEVLENGKPLMEAYAHTDHKNEILFTEHTLKSKPLRVEILYEQDLSEEISGLEPDVCAKAIIQIKRGNLIIKQIAVGVEFIPDDYTYKPSIAIKDLDEIPDVAEVAVAK